MIKGVFGATARSKQLQVSAAAVIAALELLPVEKDYMVLCTSNGADVPFDHALIQLVEAKTVDGDYSVAVEHFVLTWNGPTGIVIGFASNPRDTDIKGYVCRTQEAVLPLANKIWEFLLTGKKPDNCNFHMK